MVLSGLAGLIMAVAIVFIWAPISFGILFVDYPDPGRPGHLKGEIVSKPELLAKTAVTVGFFWLAKRLWMNLRASRR